MTILNILEFPDPRLRVVAKPVVVVDDAIRQVTDDMLETMYAASGIGLAATQVDIHQQIIVLDVSEDQSGQQVFINPKIMVQDDVLESYDEGCLSVPGFHAEVERPRGIRVEALDRNGDVFVIEPEGLLAVCLQHEIDHLNGKLFVDYLSNMKRQRIRKKLEKQQKAQA